MLDKMMIILGLTICLSTPVSGAGGGGGSGDGGPPTVSREYRQAVKAVKKEDYTKAIDLLQTVLDEDSENANAWNYMGFSLRHLKRYGEALAAYEKALKIKPKHKGALEYLGELYLQIGDLEQARAQLKILDKACFFPCKEYRELKQEIEKYEAG
jgi:tetratricopeptide (TPR) repeat protein